jgi:lantibiotic modifying enzyme
VTQEGLPRKLDKETESHASVYTGRAGVALFFLKLAQYRAERGEGSTARSLLQRAESELDAARTAKHGPHGASFLEGAAGLHAVRAAVAAAGGRHAVAALAASHVTEEEEDVASLPPGDCELLYGRAGYLHALLVARAASNAAAVPDAVRALAIDIAICLLHA